jgi:1-acyl-sn-glycerol-3-phosphate acyltransferase
MRSLAQLILRLGGWRIEGERPVAKKYVLVAAPHTSNWDFLWMIAMAVALGVRLSWLGKDSLFRPPLGSILRLLGGIPVDRSVRSDLVNRFADQFERSAEFVLVVPVEGTRGWVPYWKSGFYHIARAANVPVVLGYLDYATRIGGFGMTVDLTGDVRADMAAIRAFYAETVPKHIGQNGPIRLKEEDAGEAAPAVPAEAG